MKILGFFMAFLGLHLATAAEAVDRRAQDYAACLSEASAAFGLSENLLRAIKQVESGKSLAAPVSTNTDGSEDIGLYQINTFWLSRLDERGITRRGLLDPCVNTFAGAWILSQAVDDAGGSIWGGVGIYHSRKPMLQSKYRARVAQRLRQIAGR